MASALEDFVRQRAGGICEYCRMPQAYDDLPSQIDHIIAQKHGGPTAADNLAAACFTCNNHKGPCIAGINPDTDRIVRLFHPRKDRWKRHFRWDGSVLIGLTPIGKATIAVLDINLPHRVALRRSLMEEGFWPS